MSISALARFFGLLTAVVIGNSNSLSVRFDQRDVTHGRCRRSKATRESLWESPTIPPIDRPDSANGARSVSDRPCRPRCSRKISDRTPDDLTSRQHLLAADRQQVFEHLACAPFQVDGHHDFRITMWRQPDFRLLPFSASPPGRILHTASLSRPRAPVSVFSEESLSRT